jgi:hypothetical protein
MSKHSHLYKNDFTVPKMQPQEPGKPQAIDKKTIDGRYKPITLSGVSGSAIAQVMNDEYGKGFELYSHLTIPGNMIILLFGPIKT